MFRVRALYDGARSITLSLSALFAVACVISGVSMRKVPARLIPISHRVMCVSGLLARPGNNLPIQAAVYLDLNAILLCLECSECLSSILGGAREIELKLSWRGRCKLNLLHRHINVLRRSC